MRAGVRIRKWTRFNSFLGLARPFSATDHRRLDDRRTARNVLESKRSVRRTGRGPGLTRQQPRPFLPLTAVERESTAGCADRRLRFTGFDGANGCFWLDKSRFGKTKKLRRGPLHK